VGRGSLVFFVSDESVVHTAGLISISFTNGKKKDFLSVKQGLI
jgi:hypothetical protein